MLRESKENQIPKKMELLKVITCLCLVLILLADVMLARPTTGEATELEQFVENLQARMADSSRSSRRRRRRHTMTRDLAIMEFCIKRPHACRQEMRRLERQSPRNGRYTVVVISK